MVISLYCFPSFIHCHSLFLAKHPAVSDITALPVSFSVDIKSVIIKEILYVNAKLV